MPTKNIKSIFLKIKVTKINQLSLVWSPSIWVQITVIFGNLNHDALSFIYIIVSSFLRFVASALNFLFVGAEFASFFFFLPVVYLCFLAELSEILRS